MNHRQFHSRNLNVVLALGVVAVFGACGGSSRPKNGSGGAGGGGSGGVVGTGGATVGSGGGGGDTTPIDAGQTGTGGTGGTTTQPPGGSCVKSSDCPTGMPCLGTKCVALGTACVDSRDCSTDQVCDGERGLCVQCTKAADCQAGQECLDNKCGVSAACADSRECPQGKVCSPTIKRCVECGDDNDCVAAATPSRCVQNACKPICTTDKQCTPQLICDDAVDAGTHVCVECRPTTGDQYGDKECPESSYCDQGACKPDLCDSTTPKCVGNNLVQCFPRGNGWGGTTTKCPADKPCRAYGGAAGCGGPVLPIDGGIVFPPYDGGAIDGNAGCASGTADPCKAGIPKSPATVVVDGLDDDICGVPAFVLNATELSNSKTGKINNYNNVPLTQFETATVRVAWDAAGFHVYASVADTAVQTAAMATTDAEQARAKAYQGDSIEIFITSNNSVTGLTGKDANSLHVIIPATGEAVSSKTDNGSSGNPTVLPATQYKQAVTAGGYVIEAMLPWPGGTAPTAGTTVRFDLGLNSADKTFGGVDDMRDGQLLYYVGTVGDKTTCQSNDGTVPYCDDRTWCPAPLL